MEESDLTKFENLGQFFYRTIKPSVRTIVSKNEASLISPSDGTILHFGNVNHDEIEQVKGVTYSLNALLGPNPNSNRNPLLEPTYEAKENSKLFFTVIYLAPGDYHRFHSPTEWKIHTMRHFAGEMFSVSPFLVSRLRHLFSLNERVSLLGQWDYGMFCMVAVAATNVGKIILNSCPVFYFDSSRI
jgi:phosphatidylserine decarboxylase